MSSQHECVDCQSLPVDDRPQRPRPAIHGGPKSRRCDTHQRVHAKATRERRHDSRVQKVYGLEPGEYEELLAFQGGTCAIPSCKANGRSKKLAVDHDHETGEPRGVLCGNHNYLLLGRFVNDLQDAIAYLASPPYSRFRAARRDAA